MMSLLSEPSRLGVVKVQMYMRQVPDWPLQLVVSISIIAKGRRDGLRRGGKVGVVGTRAVLNAHQHTVVARSTLAEVVVLEVESGFGEAIPVGDIVELVDSVERVGASGVDIEGGGRSGRGVVGVVEDLAGSGLRGKGGGRALVRDNVVAASNIQEITCE
jgi:hypothetical protein